jgi:replicative DNA helicase
MALEVPWLLILLSAPLNTSATQRNLLKSLIGKHSGVRVADASRGLKLLAKELEIPVLVLSQLSRDCDKEKRRPLLSDLRDSGAIEQDADVVLFLYRQEVYDPETDEKGVAEVLIRKHRNGPIGDRRLRFVDRYARFEDLDNQT